MKIQTKNLSILGKNVVFHTIGITEIPLDGIIDVPEGLANELVQGTHDWIDLSIIKSKIKKEAPVEEEENEKTDREIAKELLKQLSVEDLVEIAERFDLDQKKYKNVAKNKPVMLAFVLKNLTEADIETIIS